MRRLRGAYMRFIGFITVGVFVFFVAVIVLAYSAGNNTASELQDNFSSRAQIVNEVRLFTDEEVADFEGR
jgi:cell division protein FtsX